ncbi:MAG: hypothetical protein ACLQGU_04315 [bacterium]
METSQIRYEETRLPLGVGKTPSLGDKRPPYRIEGDVVCRYPLIVQNFYGNCVRLFRVKFEVEIHTKKSLDLWAIPVADLASSTNYPQKFIRAMVLRNLKFFLNFHKIDFAADNRGGHESMLLIPVEMLSALTLGIQASSTKNPRVRDRARSFQAWVMVILSMIGTRKLRPLRWIRATRIDSNHLIPLLCLPSGKNHKKQVLKVAKEEGKTAGTIYRHLKFLRGCNMITSKGVPRRSRKAA